MRLCLQHLLPQALTAHHGTWMGMVQFHPEKKTDSWAECEDQTAISVGVHESIRGFPST